jgi:TetR/AcrR family transcriptional regulator, repressor for uid operon
LKSALNGGHGGAPLSQFSPVVVDRPSAPTRQRQILEAARACFRLNGFHATSMAEIATRAGMSVGHMYRYFAGKDDIIVAIVEADVTRSREEMAALEAQQADVRQMVKSYVERVVRHFADRQSAALFLEIMAESARNPKVADMVRPVRKEKFDRLRAMLARGYPDCAPDKLDQRAEALGVFLESVAFKSVTTPNFDSEAAVACMVGCVAKLFE